MTVLIPLGVGLLLVQGWLLAVLAFVQIAGASILTVQVLRRTNRRACGEVCLGTPGPRRCGGTSCRGGRGSWDSVPGVLGRDERGTACGDDARGAQGVDHGASRGVARGARELALGDSASDRAGSRLRGDRRSHDGRRRPHRCARRGLSEARRRSAAARRHDARAGSSPRYRLEVRSQVCRGARYRRWRRRSIRREARSSSTSS